MISTKLCEQKVSRNDLDMRRALVRSRTVCRVEFVDLTLVVKLRAVCLPGKVRFEERFLILKLPLHAIAHPTLLPSRV